MKKKVFSAIGVSGSAVILALVLSMGTQKTQASQINTLNISALEDSGGGACTGPKNQTTGWCESNNTNPCSDTNGCSSSSTAQ